MHVLFKFAIIRIVINIFIITISLLVDNCLHKEIRQMVEIPIASIFHRVVRQETVGQWNGAKLFKPVEAILGSLGQMFYLWNLNKNRCSCIIR